MQSKNWVIGIRITPVYTEYTSGTVVLGLVDPNESELVFSGLIQGVGDDPADLAARIDDDVEEVFDAYPRNQTGQ